MPERRAQIASRDVYRVVVVALLAIASAVPLALAVVEVQATIRWLAAAIFLALVLAPAVALVQRIRLAGHHPPRWLAIGSVFAALFVFGGVLILHVVPPLVGEVEQVGSTGPQYVDDFEEWASDSDAFRELNHRYDLTAELNRQTAELPARLGDAAVELKAITVELLRNAFSMITVLVLTFFLLLEGRALLTRMLGTLGPERARRGERIAARIYAVVRGYVTVNLLLAAAAGLFTWGVLELLGVEIAVPLAILVAFFDLVPLIGLTLGGLLVAVAVSLHSFPTALIVWAIAFLLYQQLQDRVVQPLLYGRAVQISPLVAIVALLAGAQILGVLGALIAIPVAAAIGVVYSELRPAAAEPPAPGSPEPAAAG